MGIQTGMLFTSRDVAGRIGTVPEVTVGFWIYRVLAAISSEIAGELLYHNYLHRSGRVIVALTFCFLATLALRTVAKEFSRATFWSVMFSLCILSAVLARTIDTALGIGDIGAILHTAALFVLALVICHRMMGGIAALTDRPGHEPFFWAMAIAAQTLSSGVADWLVDRGASGYIPGVAALTLALLVIIALAAFTPISRGALFWIAFVLTGAGAALGGHFGTKNLLATECGAGFPCQPILISRSMQQWSGLAVVHRLRVNRTGVSA